MKKSFLLVTILLVLLSSAFTSSKAVAQNNNIVNVNIQSSSIIWTPTLTDIKGITLTIAGPGSYYSQREYSASAHPELSSANLADGPYAYEIALWPNVSSNTGADQTLRGLDKQPQAEMRQSGTFTVTGGAFVVPAPETTAPAAPKTDVGPLDVVNADDFIVQGKLCVGGPECVTGEAFGYDVIRMKELSTRITFDDTSTGAFPANDWRITANDNASGGANYLAFEDATGGKVPFKVMAGAPNNALLVGSTGNVGLGTNVPAVEFHIASTDTPTVRLEQLAYGWSPYTWEVAGNESNFFIRDVTGGSNLPFRIRPGAPTSAIDINDNGNVGIGRATASYDLEVWNVSADTTLGVSRDGGVTATLKASTAEARLGTANNFPLLFDVNNANVMTLATNGNVGIGTTTPIADLDIANTGTFAAMNVRRTDGANLVFAAGLNQGSIGTASNSALAFNVNNVQKMTLATSGALTVLGPVNATVFNTTSDKYAKENFTAIDQKTVLDRLSTMPISTWNFIENDNKAKHLGPMAQDFYAAFGLGADDKHISSVDADGVAFAAIQELNKRNQALSAENTSLSARVAALEAGSTAANQPSQNILIILLVGMNLGLIALVGWAIRRGAFSGSR